MRNSPRQRHLRRTLAVPRPNLAQQRLVDQLPSAAPPVVDVVLVAKGRVLRDMDPPLRIPRRKRALLQPWVQLQLVHRRHDARLAEQPVQLRPAEVRDADGARLARCQQCLHGLPRGNVVGVAGGRVARGVFGEERRAAGEGRGPVHQVEVDVGGVEGGEGGVERGGDVIRVVGVVPEFGGEEDFGARDGGGVDCVADGGLGAVDVRGVNVAIACLEGGCYGCFG